MFKKISILLIISIALLFNFSCKKEVNVTGENTVDTGSEMSGEELSGTTPVPTAGTVSNFNGTDSNRGLKGSNEEDFEVKSDGNNTVVKDSEGNEFNVTVGENKTTFNTGDGREASIVKSGNTKVFNNGKGQQLEIKDKGVNVTEYTDSEGNIITVTDEGVFVKKINQ